MPERPRLTPEGAAEIRRLKTYPSLAKIIWKPCRICLEYCPAEGWGPPEEWDNKHITCAEVPKVPAKRRSKELDPNQSAMF